MSKLFTQNRFEAISDDAILKDQLQEVENQDDFYSKDILTHLKN